MKRVAINIYRLRALLVLLLAAALATGLLALVETRAAKAAFPGVNGRIAFESNRVTSTNPTGDYEIFSMNPDGTGVKQLTNNLYDDRAPVLSADGTKIAFTSTRAGNYEVFVMNADGTKQTRLTNSGSLWFSATPAWSPDGAKIAFWSTRTPDGRPKVFTMNSDGTDRKQLINDDFNDAYPAWSPDGTKLAFSRTGFCSTGAFGDVIYTAKPDGTEITKLTDLCDGQDYEPAWSPDGSKIAFTQLGALDPTGSFYHSNIYVIDANGANQALLIDNAAADNNPAWSPDGSKMAFTSSVDPSNKEVFVVKADGSGTPTNLTNTTASDGGPNWGPCKDVCDVTPDENTTDVPRNTNVTATFSDELNPATLTASTIKMKVGKKTVPIGISCDSPCQTVTLDPYPADPARLLAANKKYKVIITTGVKDTTGHALASNYVWTFTTGSS